MKTDNRYKTIGGKHRAVTRYYMILHRISHSDLPKNRKYSSVRMLIPKETFVEWFMKNDFEGASVDRIDKNGDYSIDNIQLIPLKENIRKDKTKSKNGKCVCCVCKIEKPIELFQIDKRRKNGHGTMCKQCDARRRCKTK